MKQGAVRSDYLDWLAQALEGVRGPLEAWLRGAVAEEVERLRRRQDVPAERRGARRVRGVPAPGSPDRRLRGDGAADHPRP